MKHWVYAKQGYNLWNNVYKINQNLEIEWQIQGSKPRCYVSIIHNNGEFEAIDWEGVCVVVDMNTGKVIREYLVK
ncbi:hypothetical protein ACLVWU_12465 [Bdellovibrio sp. HCB290]|uniref:hypothetical protein n=1 Tax=Bdellovibrio sp. HCB290 TaxID=3394356 RepID=UPI0039B4339F